MSRYSDLELRYARPVAQAILDDDLFRAWMLEGTDYVGARPIGASQGAPSGREKNPAQNAKTRSWGA